MHHHPVAPDFTEPVVLLGSRSTGVTILEMERVAAASPHRILVEVTDGGLRAATWVYEYPDFGRLVELLAGMETDWRGWNGQRRWSSLEGEMTVRAEHTGRDVRLDVDLRHSGWSASTQITLGAGEDVSRAVRAAETWLT